MTAEAGLLDHGAHLVLVTREKRPISGRSWTRLRPAAIDAERHRQRGGVLAVVPWSIRATALDLDVGNAEQLVLRFGRPWAKLPSRRRGGVHLYYDDIQPRSNAKWAVGNASGDVRSGSGYLILWNDGPELLLAALRQRVANAHPFPLELLEPPAPPPAAIVQAGDEAPLLETQLEPGRELALFDDLRFWAYKQEKGSSRSGWGGRVLARAILRNPLLPDPLDLSEIRSTARSIADWTFGGKGAFDHSPDVQGRRGRAGGKVKRWRVESRDRSMVSRLDVGDSLRVVARAHGCCHRTVATARARLALPRRAPRGRGGYST